MVVAPACSLPHFARRHDPVAVRGKTMFVEYRRETPQGEQNDALDVFEIDQGRIKSLRVYWGWRTVGQKTLPRRFGTEQVGESESAPAWLDQHASSIRHPVTPKRDKRDAARSPG